MRISLAFDVHGTLVDASSVIHLLDKYFGSQAEEVLSTWKYKQREYAFRHRLMEEDVDFTVCSEQALEYACLFHKVDIKEEEKAAIMEYSKALPAYPEALQALKSLKGLGFRLFAFSNGPQEEVRSLLKQAGLASQFENIYSVQGTKTFKPDPEVYENFLRYNHTGHQFTWFISGNSFDIIGAKNVGLKVVWVQRSPDIVMDPWGIEPDKTVNLLSDLVGFFKQQIIEKNRS